MSLAGKTALMTLMIQLAITTLGMALSWGFHGWNTALSAGFGGLIGLISTAYFALRIYKKSVRIGDDLVIGGMGMTQLSKYTMIVALISPLGSQFSLLNWGLT